MHLINKIMKQYIYIITKLLPELTTVLMKMHAFGSSLSDHYFVNSALISTNNNLFVRRLDTNIKNYS